MTSLITAEMVELVSSLVAAEEVGPQGIVEQEVAAADRQSRLEIQEQVVAEAAAQVLVLLLELAVAGAVSGCMAQEPMALVEQALV